MRSGRPQREPGRARPTGTGPTGPGRRGRAGARPCHRRPARRRGHGPARPTWPRRWPRAVEGGRHLVVQAGTGTGKSLAYLVPAIAVRPHHRRGHGHQGPAGPARQQGPPVPGRAPRRGLRVGGAEGAQQLPLPAAGAGGTRSRGGQLELEDLAPVRRSRRSSAWRRGPVRPTTGDRAELDWSPGDRAWAAVSVSSEECPGAAGAPWASRASPRPPAGGRPQPTSWSSTPTSTASTWARGGDDPARARRRGDRRGPPARGHHLRHGRHGIGVGTLRDLARSSRRILADPDLVAAVSDAGTDLSDVALAPRRPAPALPAPRAVGRGPRPGPAGRRTPR